MQFFTSQVYQVFQQTDHILKNRYWRVNGQIAGQSEVPLSGTFQGGQNPAPPHFVSFSGHPAECIPAAGLSLPHPNPMRSLEYCNTACFSAEGIWAVSQCPQARSAGRPTLQDLTSGSEPFQNFLAFLASKLGESLLLGFPPTHPVPKNIFLPVRSLESRNRACSSAEGT